jgi:hypothetical protein
MATDKYYTITITDIPGTSLGPYTIYLNQVYGVIPQIYPSLLLAENLTLSQLITGVIIKVSDVPASIVVHNNYCGNDESLIPPVTIIYESFCLSFESPSLDSTVYKHFIPNGMVGGYPSWIDDSLPEPVPPITITWDTSQTLWVLNNYQPSGQYNVITSNSPSNSNPPSSWSSAGGDTNVTINLLPNSECPVSGPLLFRRSTNNPTCICDGSIIFNVTLDNPPFTYSINNGVTYSTSPIFTNLCSGMYILAVKDSLGNVHTSSETVETLTETTTYTISLYTTNTTPVINNVSIINEYETTVVISPPLPDGATITFDLIHNNNFYSSPTSGTSILTTGTLLYKNGSEVLLSNSSNSDNQFVNSDAGCQTEYVYQSNINDVWSSLTMTNSDTITISTSSRVDKTTSGQCVVGYSNDNYSIGNPVIGGCDCCSIKIN